MRIVYLLLSPTFGMHLYTADLANRLAEAGHDVQLVTTARAPRAPYSAQVRIHTPIAASGTGFAPEGLDLLALRRVVACIDQITAQGLSSDPSGRGQALPSATLVHITGVHLWNPLLVRWLHRRRLPVIHSLHDLDPHLGVRFGRLIRLWNRTVVASADQILVHGQVYRERLLALGAPAARITYTPLLHLFLSHAGFASLTPSDVQFEHWALFFGRLERYKGVEELIAAGARLPSSSQHPHRLVLAGPGTLSPQTVAFLPQQVDVRNRLIGDEEGIDLFRRCALVALPYLDATQSALIASAYYFQKPVIVTTAGALAEYVEDGQTGWIVPAGDVEALAGRLAEALSDPDRLRRMGAAGRAWYDRQRALEWRSLLTMYQLTSTHLRGNQP